MTAPYWHTQSICRHCFQPYLDTRKLSRPRKAKFALCSVACAQAEVVQDKPIADRYESPRRPCANCQCIIADVRTDLGNHELKSKKYCTTYCMASASTGRPRGKRANNRTTGGYLISDVVKGKTQHVAIAEQALGRPLKRGEVVHHINGIKTDNRNCNLLICTRGYHQWLHAEMGRRYMTMMFTNVPVETV